MISARGSEVSEPEVFDFVGSQVQGPDQLRDAINQDYDADETVLVNTLLERVQIDAARQNKVNQSAAELVAEVRARKSEQGVLDAFMLQYDLSSEEGVVLMCLAEALLRIPDNETAEKLIADKLGDGDWEAHIGKSDSIFVNASTWGLMLTGKMIALSEDTKRSVSSALARLINRSGEPLVRTAIRQSMRIMAHQYVMGRTIDEAMERAGRKRNRSFRYSFDMLGEAALTAHDAARYLESYRNAIKAVGAHIGGAGIDDGVDDGANDGIYSAPSISVKLSALHPRYEYVQRDRVIAELSVRVLELAQLAKANNLALTIDAEEADRLLLNLDVFDAVLADRSLAGWNGLGLALQAYQKRAMAVLAWLEARAVRLSKRIPIRLVKGAYWDTEIKHAQVEGYHGYPVYTRKANTDVAYIACAMKLLSARQSFYPQFATHNAHTIASIAEFAGDRLDFEYQRLHGMGEDLYAVVMENDRFHDACRVYAPVGSHEDLLPYLVRRLLENGANTSFVNRIVDESMPVSKVAENPIERVRNTQPIYHPAIALPRNLYGDDRLNSYGINLANEREARQLAQDMQQFARRQWRVEPLLAGRDLHNGTDDEPRVESNMNPGRASDCVGSVRFATATEVEGAITTAQQYVGHWDAVPADQRAAMLERTADLFENNMPELMALCCREAGKTLLDGIAEVREAADFCRYYALQARKHFSEPLVLPGPTGEHNQLTLHGKGVFACISPWNFPLAIFSGQIVAALAAGNTVLAKPAEQTPAIASVAVSLMHQAGIPPEALQLLTGEGAGVGAQLCTDPRIDGVAFTGSTETARVINRSLAARDAPLATLIAETGGQNTMLVDSSALPEQVVQDVIGSAFLSAGQRCSALRVLYLQEEVADRIIELLSGAMDELVIGNPGLLKTDVGPVIDEDALQVLLNHTAWLSDNGTLIAQRQIPAGLDGHYFAPCAFEIDSISQLSQEVFGPVLHVVRYASSRLDAVIDEINGTGYGLTMGVHSRIDDTQEYIAARIRAGNCYVNRTMTGAVVGVQPFGGERLSGTGPKAGGPHYMLRFATERTLTVNTAAVGGNAGLLALDD